jgi:hypothetical protein
MLGNRVIVLAYLRSNKCQEFGHTIYIFVVFRPLKQMITL